MKKITRAAGNVTFTLPDSASDPGDFSVSGKRQRRGAQTATEATNQELAALLTALTEDDEQGREEHDYQLLDGFSVDLGEGAKKPIRRGPAAKHHH